MLAEYIDAALDQATYDKLDTGEYYGEILICPGVWATGQTLEACRKELIEVVEDWLLLKLRDGDFIPIIKNIDLNLQKV